jgi:hypothetical protein
MRLRGERAQCGFLFGGLGIPNSSDLLPDEMYQKLMSPLFAQWAEEVAHKRSIIANHRKDFARTLHRRHMRGTVRGQQMSFGRCVCQAWLVGKKKERRAHVD